MGALVSRHSGFFCFVFFETVQTWARRPYGPARGFLDGYKIAAVINYF